jgi:NAD(P)-dependent dehydrogenase (short-subunit alcohol dehydrogenase family)
MMKDKRVLVSGAGTGIGREIALEFAREGAAVVLHYAHSEGGAMSAVKEIQQSNGQAIALQADFTQVDAVKQLAGRALEFLGGLDVLVNNAGITMNLPFEQVTPEQFDTLYHVNIRAQFFLTQAALPALIQSGGVVINLTSIHAFEGYPEHSVYAGTKGAIVAFTRELAVELAPKGVRVNAIAPGAVAVENHYKAAPNYDPEANGKLIPCGFEGLPLDIARVAVFLASEGARYIVGQTLIVDGGTTSWMPFSDAFRQPSTSRFGRGYVPGM